MTEQKKPDYEYDCERYTVRGYFGGRSREELTRMVKEAAAEYLRKIRPELIRQGKLDKYSILANKTEK